MSEEFFVPMSFWVVMLTRIRSANGRGDTPPEPRIIIRWLDGRQIDDDYRRASNMEEPSRDSREERIRDAITLAKNLWNNGASRENIESRLSRRGLDELAIRAVLRHLPSVEPVDSNDSTKVSYDYYFRKEDPVFIAVVALICYAVAVFFAFIWEDRRPRWPPGHSSPFVRWGCCAVFVVAGSRILLSAMKVARRNSADLADHAGTNRAPRHRGTLMTSLENMSRTATSPWSQPMDLTSTWRHETGRFRSRAKATSRGHESGLQPLAGNGRGHAIQPDSRWEAEFHAGRQKLPWQWSSFDR